VGDFSLTISLLLFIFPYPLQDYRSPLDGVAPSENSEGMQEGDSAREVGIGGGVRKGETAMQVSGSGGGLPLALDLSQLRGTSSDRMQGPAPVNDGEAVRASEKTAGHASEPKLDVSPGVSPIGDSALRGQAAAPLVQVSPAGAGGTGGGAGGGGGGTVEGGSGEGGGAGGSGGGAVAAVAVNSSPGSKTSRGTARARLPGLAPGSKLRRLPALSGGGAVEGGGGGGGGGGSGGGGGGGRGATPEAGAEARAGGGAGPVAEAMQGDSQPETPTVWGNGSGSGILQAEKQAWETETQMEL
jgi:hypothetical protein